MVYMNISNRVHYSDVCRCDGCVVRLIIKSNENYAVIIPFMVIELSTASEIMWFSHCVIMVMVIVISAGFASDDLSLIILQRFLETIPGTNMMNKLLPLCRSACTSF